MGERGRSCIISFPFSKQYDAIDRHCLEFTVRENLVGEFTEES